MKNKRTASANSDKIKQPRYQKIAEQLLRDIQSGALPVGEILEPEKLLGDKFRASRGTIRQSLSVLEELGIILRKQRSGTKIVSRFPSKGAIRADQLLEDWARYGTDYPLRMSSVSRSSLPADLFKGEEQKSKKWLYIVGLRYPIGSRVPISFCQTYIRPDYSKIEQDFSATPLPMFAYLENRYGRLIETVQVSLRAMGLPNEMAGPLGGIAGQPALQLVRLYMDRDRRVIIVGINTHPAERYNYNIEIPRLGVVDDA